MLSVGFSIGQVTLFALISACIGIIAGLWLSPGARQARQLAIKLEQTEAKLEQYQQQVTNHFVTTSQHFRELTTQYYQLFEHLRTSANQLCSDERIQSQLAAIRMPSKSLLDAEIHDINIPTDYSSKKQVEIEPA